MFEPEKEVPSLELCKRLKKLGYPQDDGGWYWTKTKNDEEYDLYFLQEDGFPVEVFTGKEIIVSDEEDTAEYYEIVETIKAPTVRELGEWLPAYINEQGNYLNIDRPSSDVWIISYIDLEHPLEKSIVAFDDKTEANARAKMLIWLVENGYVKF